MDLNNEMDGWIEGWMREEGSGRSRCTHRCIHARIQGRTDREKEAWMERRKKGEMDGKRE